MRDPFLFFGGVPTIYVWHQSTYHAATARRVGQSLKIKRKLDNWRFVKLFIKSLDDIYWSITRWSGHV